MQKGRVTVGAGDFAEIESFSVMKGVVAVSHTYQEVARYSSFSRGSSTSKTRLRTHTRERHCYHSGYRSKNNLRWQKNREQISWCLNRPACVRKKRGFIVNELSFSGKYIVAPAARRVAPSRLPPTRCSSYCCAPGGTFVFFCLHSVHAPFGMRWVLHTEAPGTLASTHTQARKLFRSNVCHLTLDLGGSTRSPATRRPPPAASPRPATPARQAGLLSPSRGPPPPPHPPLCRPAPVS